MELLALIGIVTLGCVGVFLVLLIFEVGKCYEHTTGKKMRIISEVDTYFYGHGLLAETNTGQYEIVGMKEEHTINWKECDDFAEEVCDRTENAMEPAIIRKETNK